jgi:hypothetical protein
MFFQDQKQWKKEQRAFPIPAYKRKRLSHQESDNTQYIADIRKQNLQYCGFTLCESLFMIHYVSAER